MNLSQVQTAIEQTPKGANIIIEWVRPVKTLAAFKGADLTKSVRMVGRMGIDYDKQKSVQEKRETGELPSESQPLPWGNWAIFPYLIEHKGNYYVRLYNGTSDKVRPEVHFFLDGNEVAFESIAHMLPANEKQEKHGDCFTCKVENMTRIHHESEWIALFASVEQETVKLFAEPVPAKILATM